LRKNKMKMEFFLFVLLLVFVLCNAASAATNPEPANSSAVVTDQSAIDGHQMVYQQMVSATQYDIYKKDLHLGTTTQVTGSTRNDCNPDISGDIVVWQSKASDGSGKWQIYWKDTSTNNPEALVHSNAGFDQINPSVSGNNVVWQEYSSPSDADTGYGKDDWDIKGYNLATNSYYGAIDNSNQEDCNPDISGNIIVYQKYCHVQSFPNDYWTYQVYMTNFGTSNLGIRLKPTDVIPKGEENAVISGNNVVWQDRGVYISASDYDICYHNLSTNGEFWVTQTTDQWDHEPAIAGNMVVWTKNYYLTGSGTDWDIKMKDISNPANPEITVAGSSYNQNLPAVGVDQYGIFVSYTDTLDGYNRVYWRNMGIDNTAPTVTSTNPAQYAVNLPSNQVFTVTFSEAIKAANLNLVVLKTSTGTIIPTTKTISANVLTITPNSALSEAKYLLLLYAGCVTDLAGNPTAALSRTYGVGAQPYVTSTDPANYAMNVVRNKVITVTFNEPIVAKYLTLVYLKTSTGTVITATKSVSGNTLTITPSTTLAAGTRYIVTIYSFAVTDLAGNSNVNKAFSFTTGST
jgi:beta propeller repeat protein